MTTRGAPPENTAAAPPEGAAPPGVAAGTQAQRDAINAAVTAATGGANVPPVAPTPTPPETPRAPETPVTAPPAHHAPAESKDTIQGLIDSAKKFRRAGPEEHALPDDAPTPPIPKKEKMIAGGIAGTTAAASGVSAWGQWLASGPAGTLAHSVGSGINGTAAAAYNFINNIPFVGPGVAEGLAATQNFVTSGVTALGGPLSYGTLGVAAGGLGALWGLGKLKSVVTREQYKGFWRPVYEGIKTPVQLGIGAVKIPYQAVVHGPGYVADKAYGATKTVLNNTVVPAYNWAKTNLWENSAAKPTAWGIGMGLAGAGILAPWTGGSSLIVGAGMYGLGNYLKNNGYMKKADAAAHGAAH